MGVVMMFWWFVCCRSDVVVNTMISHPYTYHLILQPKPKTKNQSVMRRAIPEVRDGTLSVAAVSPYKAQARLLRELFDAALGGQAAARAVDVNTIDGFQVGSFLLGCAGGF
jgi:hypothetical protein